MLRHILFHSVLRSPDTAEGTATKEQAKPEAKVEVTPKEELEKLSPEELKARQKELKEITRDPSKRNKKEEKKPEAKEPKAEPPKEKVEPKEKKDPEAKPETNEKKEPAAKKVEPKPAPQPRRQEPEEEPQPIGRIVTGDQTASSARPELKSTMELSAKDKRKLRVIQQMEDDGTADKGTAERVLKFWEKEAAYQKQWEAAHPNEEFDSAADEHTDFYTKHEVVYNPEDYEIARDRVVEQEALEKVEGRRKQEETQKQKIESFKKSQGKIAHQANENVIAMIAQAAPDLAELLGKDGERKLNSDGHKAMLEKDPVVTEILQETGEELFIVSSELRNLWEHQDIYQMDVSKPVTLAVSGRKFYPHAEVRDFMVSLQKELLALPAEKTTRDGKRLVPAADFNKAVESIINSQGTDQQKKAALDDLDAKYWTLDLKDYETAITAQFAAKAKAEIERFNKRHGLRTPKTGGEGASAGSGASATQAGGTQESTDEKQAAASRVKSPSTATSSDALDAGKKPDLSQTEEAKNLLARSRGR